MTRLATALSAALILVAVALSAAGPAAKTLDVYFIDVEGGQAILFISPSGQSLLLDSGGDFNAKGEPSTRDSARILEIAKKAGLRQLDYALVTHYHQDHAAGLPLIAASLPVRAFIDHGDLHAPDLEGERGARVYRDYVAARASGRHVELRPGERLSLGAGVDLTGVASAAQPIKKALNLPGAGTPNPLCSGFVRRPEDKTMAASLRAENAASVATVVTFGKFSLLDLGDMVWNQTFDLVCPNNLIGEVSVYVTPVHGLNLSGPPALVHALRPRIAIWNNGPLKGSREPIDIVRSSPGLEDLWQLHYELLRPASAFMGETVESGGPSNNAPDDFIANLTGKDAGPSGGAQAAAHEGADAAYIKLTARPDGSFSVTNSRTGFTKQYGRARRAS